MNILELKTWAIKNNVEKKTKDSFVGFLNNYKNDDVKEYNEFIATKNINDMTFDLFKVSLDLGNWPECDRVTVSGHLRISYKDNQIARYTCLFTTDGNAVDAFVDFM